jgi:hypothetical protein
MKGLNLPLAQHRGRVRWRALPLIEPADALKQTRPAGRRRIENARNFAFAIR